MKIFTIGAVVAVSVAIAAVDPLVLPLHYGMLGAVVIAGAISLCDVALEEDWECRPVRTIVSMVVLSGICAVLFFSLFRLVDVDSLLVTTASGACGAMGRSGIRKFAGVMLERLGLNDGPK